MYVPAQEDSPSAMGLEFSEITLVDRNKKIIEASLFILTNLHKKIL